MPIFMVAYKKINNKKVNLKANATQKRSFKTNILNKMKQDEYLTQNIRKISRFFTASFFSFKNKN